MLQSPDIGKNSDVGISDFQISGQPLIKENCYNSTASDDIDKKLGPVTKLDKRKISTSKKFNVDLMSENYDVIVIFGFLANLKQSGDRIPDTESAKVMFSVIGTICLTKSSNRTKKSPAQLSHYFFE